MVYIFLVVFFLHFSNIMNLSITVYYTFIFNDCISFQCIVVASDQVPLHILVIFIFHYCIKLG